MHTSCVIQRSCFLSGLKLFFFYFLNTPLGKTNQSEILQRACELTSLLPLTGKRENTAEIRIKTPVPLSSLCLTAIGEILNNPAQMERLKKQREN